MAKNDRNGCGGLLNGCGGLKNGCGGLLRNGCGGLGGLVGKNPSASRNEATPARLTAVQQAWQAARVVLG